MDVAVADWVLLSAVAASLLLVGLAQAVVVPKASAMAVANSVFFMVFPLKIAG